MVLCVNVGLADLTNPRAEDDAGRTYSLFIGDTVLVGEVRSPLTLCHVVLYSVCVCACVRACVCVCHRRARLSS